MDKSMLALVIAIAALALVFYHHHEPGKVDLGA
jgi:hypothetical protein